MCPGACRCLSAFSRQCAPCWKSWRSLGVIACVSVLLLTAPGCSWTNSTQDQVPTLPVLASLRRLSLEGTPGLWMSEDDAGRLAVWIYDVTGEDGR